MMSQQWTQMNEHLYIIPSDNWSQKMIIFNLATSTWKSTEPYNQNVISEETCLCNNGTNIFLVISGYIVSYNVKNDNYTQHVQIMNNNLLYSSCAIIINTQIMYIFATL